MRIKLLAISITLILLSSYFSTGANSNDILKEPNPYCAINTLQNFCEPSNSTNENYNNVLANIPISFTENRGQLANDDVRFYDQNGGVWFTDDGMWLEIREEITKNSRESRVGSQESDKLFNPMELFEPSEPREYRRIILKQEFVGANQIKPVGREPLGYSSNFFYGNDPSNWRTNIPNYQEIYYENIYDGIDLRYYSNQKGLKYDFIIHPGADLDQIRIKYAGADSLEIDTTGNLIINTQIEQVVDGGLLIYQDNIGGRNTVQGRFKLFNNLEYGFEILQGYDEEEILVIDPFVMLEYSTYIGGTNSDI